MNFSGKPNMWACWLSCCASCGIAEDANTKLKKCIDCNLVRYCSDTCQENHRSYHEEACKKRAAELRAQALIEVPKSTHRGDCPICCLPLSLDYKKNWRMACCSKLLCIGCDHANMKGKGVMSTCPFCRVPLSFTHDESYKRMMKRIEANDPGAMCEEGNKQYNEGNYSKSFEYHTKAAELGYIESHFELARHYKHGRGVEKDIVREIHHLEEATLGGHPEARYELGWHEWDKASLDDDKKGNAKTAVQHWIIAASQGDDGSIKSLMSMFRHGVIQKDILAMALRAHQAAVDATKSPQRDEAERRKCSCKTCKTRFEVH